MPSTHHTRGLSCQVLAAEPGAAGGPWSHGAPLSPPGGFRPSSACSKGEKAGRQGLQEGPPPSSSGARPPTLDLKGHPAGKAVLGTPLWLPLHRAKLVSTVGASAFAVPPAWHPLFRSSPRLLPWSHLLLAALRITRSFAVPARLPVLRPRPGCSGQRPPARHSARHPAVPGPRGS